MFTKYGYGKKGPLARVYGTGLLHGSVGGR